MQTSRFVSHLQPSPTPPPRQVHRILQQQIQMPLPETVQSHSYHQLLQNKVQTEKQRTFWVARNGVPGKGVDIGDCARCGRGGGQKDQRVGAEVGWVFGGVGLWESGGSCQYYGFVIDVIDCLKYLSIISWFSLLQIPNLLDLLSLVLFFILPLFIFFSAISSIMESVRISAFCSWVITTMRGSSFCGICFLLCVSSYFLLFLLGSIGLWNALAHKMIYSNVID